MFLPTGRTLSKDVNMAERSFVMEITICRTWNIWNHVFSFQPAHAAKCGELYIHALPGTTSPRTSGYSTMLGTAAHHGMATRENWVASDRSHISSRCSQ